MWNDQPTKEHAAGSSYAHSKGVFHFDDKQGFYMIHSMPAFPTTKDEGYDKLPDTTYGQSFMCITMATKEFEKLGADLKTMHVYPFDFKFSSDFEKSMPNLVDAMNKVEDKDNVTRETKLQSIDGQTFTHFAKGRDYGLPLYEDFVAQSLDKDLACNTWQNGAYDNQVPTFCPPDYNHTVSNVITMNFNGDEWKSTQDHSKWAVSVDEFDLDSSSSPYSCVGGINRQFSQEKRGGATMCIENKDLNSAFFNAINEFEDCDSK